MPHPELLTIDKYLLIRFVWCVGEEKVTCDAGPLLTCGPSHSNDRTVRDQHEVRYIHHHHPGLKSVKLIVKIDPGSMAL